MIEHCIKLPVEALAVRWDGTDFDEVEAFLASHGVSCRRLNAEGTLRLTDSGISWDAELGDWLVYCAPDLDVYDQHEFEELFAVVDAQKAETGGSAEGTGPLGSFTWEHVREELAFTEDEERDIARIRAEQTAAARREQYRALAEAIVAWPLDE